MFLKNLKTNTYPPFLYSLQYEPKTYALQFVINPACIPILQKINPENLVLQYCREKLGFTDFQPDLEKDFGFNNCSTNEGIKDELLTISFPVKAPFVVSRKKCGFCGGKKKLRNDHTCYSCRGTGKEFSEKTNIDAICASMYVLTKYLNWQCLKSDHSILPENKWGQQDIFIELDPRAGVGGECSPDFFEQISSFSEEAEVKRQIELFELYLHIEGKGRFPESEFFCREYEFRSEIGSKGKFYIEVPGQNGCAIHMAHNSDVEFTCHNIDVPRQHLCLVAGFASIVAEFWKRKKKRPQA